MIHPEFEIKINKICWENAELKQNNKEYCNFIEEIKQCLINNTSVNVILDKINNFKLSSSYLSFNK